jgi:hypothetical protein
LGSNACDGPAKGLLKHLHSFQHELVKFGLAAHVSSWPSSKPSTPQWPALCCCRGQEETAQPFQKNFASFAFELNFRHCIKFNFKIQPPCTIFFLVYDALKPTKENDRMTLTEFFEDKPRGAKIAMARKLNVSKTWMSLIISGRELASPELSGAIERYTKGQVKRTTLRPDIFGDLK